MSSDDELHAAWGITPARFLFERALPQLVELPSIWTSFPLNGRGADELLPEIESIVVDHQLPSPHLVVSGQGRVVVLWHIEPLHMPAALKAEATPAEKQQHEHQTYAFKRCLRDWQRAAVKLRLAFGPLGAEPHTVATVEQQLLEHIPFPLEPHHPARLISDLRDDPPDLWLSVPHARVRIVDVSMPLKAFEAAMWNCFKVARPRRGASTKWLESEASRQALSTTAPGDRHRAAVTIICACVWDGLSEQEALLTLREWASRCAQDGAFPWRRRSGDELEHLARWAFSKLAPGGPTPRDGSTRAHRRSPVDAAAAAVLAMVAAADGELSATLFELRREAALETGAMKPIARTTLKRAVLALKSQGLLEQTVTRVGRTWCSTFRLGPSAGAAESGLSEVQKRESLWAPDPAVEFTGGGSGDASPEGRGVRGEGAQPETFLDVNEVDEASLHGVDNGALASLSPENDLPESTLLHERRRRRPQLLSLPFASSSTSSSETRRPRRRRRGDEVPALTEDVFDELREDLVDGSVRRHLQDAGLSEQLTDDALRELLKEAHSRLRPRPRLQKSFLSTLRRAAQRILRLRAFAEMARQLAETRKRRHSLATTELVPAQTENRFAEVFAAQRRPLHELAPVERARRLVQHELSLVVLEPRSKQPPPGSTWTSSQLMCSRLPSLERQLETQGPEAGLAIVCGPVSGIVVVDLDDTDAVLWANKHLAETPWRTKTTKGEHWFYRLPDSWAAPTEKLPYKGQLQSTGRYVVAPGSIHPDSGLPYEALGDWSKPKSALPLFDNQWLIDVDALRARRLRILTKSDE